jgi:hypothetical protein
MLIEYLTGEAGGTDEQSTSAKISRLILAGNSLVPTEETIDTNLEYKSVRLLPIEKIIPCHILATAGASSGNDIYVSQPDHWPLGSLG